MMPSGDLITQQQQPMTNHRAREARKQKYHQVISITGSLLSVSIFVFSCQTSNCQLLASHIIHVLPKHVPYYMHMCVLLHNYM